jgi:hypothetical protein
MVKIMVVMIMGVLTELIMVSGDMIMLVIMVDTLTIVVNQ